MGNDYTDIRKSYSSGENMIASHPSKIEFQMSKKVKDNKVLESIEMYEEVMHTERE
jgi:hypothetical protein